MEKFYSWYCIPKTRWNRLRAMLELGTFDFEKQEVDAIDPYD